MPWLPISTDNFQKEELDRVTGDDITGVVEAKLETIDAFSFNLEITNRMDSEVITRHAIEIIDDRGNSVIDARVSPDTYFSKSSKNVTNFRIDDRLDDGYYIVRARVVFAGPNGIDNNAQTERFLEVIDGTRKVISSKDFSENSLERVAITEIKNGVEK